MKAIQKFQGSRWFPSTLAMVLGIVGARDAMATDYGAVTDGTWGNAATWTASGVPGGSDNAFLGSSYPPGSAAAATVTLDADESIETLFLGNDSNGTLNLAGHQLTVNSQLILGNNGGSGTIVHNGGSFSTPNLSLYSSNSLVFGIGDTVSSNVTVSGSSLLTTTAAGNVSGYLSVLGGSTLTLGAPMTLSNQLNVEENSTLNMAGNPLSAPSVSLGWNAGQPVTVLNRAAIAATTLSVANQTFDLIASDAVTTFNLSSGTSTLYSPLSVLSLSSTALATTTAAGNVSGNVSVLGGSTLTLGAPMTLSSQIDVEENSTLNMAGYPLTANMIYLGSNDGQPVTLQGSGTITTNNLSIGGGSAVTLPAFNSLVNNQITLSGNSTLTLQQANGQLKGLSLHGENAGALSVNNTSVLQVTAGSNSGPSWIFRWQDSAAGTWESTLSGLIAAGRIMITAPAGYSVFDEEGYTYIAAPTTLVWNGAGNDNNWSNAANWGGAAPTAGQWLRFGALALTPSGHAANTNNITGNPLFYGIFFDSRAPSYNLQGNAIQLSGDVLNQSDNDQTISLNVQLVPGNGAFNTDSIMFDTGANRITVAGSISGSGMALVKTGSGTLILSGADTYSGGTTVDDGTLVATNSTAVPDGTSLTVGAGSTLAFDPSQASASPPTSGAVAVPEPGTLLPLAAALVVGFGVWLRRKSA